MTVSPTPISTFSATGVTESPLTSTSTSAPSARGRVFGLGLGRVGRSIRTAVGTASGEADETPEGCPRLRRRRPRRPERRRAAAGRTTGRRGERATAVSRMAPLCPTAVVTRPRAGGQAVASAVRRQSGRRTPGGARRSRRRCRRRRADRRTAEARRAPPGPGSSCCSPFTDMSWCPFSLTNPCWSIPTRAGGASNGALPGNAGWSLARTTRDRPLTVPRPSMSTSPGRSPAPSPSWHEVPPGLRAEPLTVAHRGASDVAPENTLAAVRRAVAPRRRPGRGRRAPDPGRRPGRCSTTPRSRRTTDASGGFPRARPVACPGPDAGRGAACSTQASWKGPRCSPTSGSRPWTRRSWPCCEGTERCTAPRR